MPNYRLNPEDGTKAQQHTARIERLTNLMETDPNARAAVKQSEQYFEENNQIDKAQPGWAYQIGQADVRDVKESDAIFAIVNGTPPDEGVMVELGIAIALGKKTFLFRDDFRRCTDSEDYALNLMLFTGLPERGWEDYYYTSLDEVADPDKALARWLNGAMD